MTHSIIAHLTTGHGPFDIRIYHKECVSLAAQGYEVILVAPGASGQAEVENGVRVIPVNKPKRRWQRMLLTGYFVVRAALRRRPSVVHLHDAELLVWTPLLRLLGKRVIFDMHENMPKALETKPWLPKALRKPIARLFHLTERLLLTGVAVIFAEKSYAADYPWVHRSQVVLNMPILKRLLSLEISPGEKLAIGYIGAVAVERGSMSTIDALAALNSQGVNVRWECIGAITRQGHRQELENRVAELGMGEQVTFHGFLPPQQGWQVLTSCFCGVAVLLPIPNYVGSYPTKIFEYMALGLPVITSNFPLYREVVERWECGICVDPLKPEEFPAAIRSILENPARAKIMGENGKRAVREEYNWDNECAKLVNFYREIQI